MIINKLNFADSITIDEKRELLKDEYKKLVGLNNDNEWNSVVFRKYPKLLQKKFEIEQTCSNELNFMKNIKTNEEIEKYIDEQINLEVLNAGNKLYADLITNLDTPHLVEFVHPFVLYALEEIEKDISDMDFKFKLEWDVIKQNLADAIAGELLNYSMKMLALEMYISKLQGNLDSDSSTKRHDEFILKNIREYDRRNSLYDEYTVLTRVIIKRCEYFIKNILELFKRLEKDEDHLFEFFNISNKKLLSIGLGNSDTHNKGKTVVMLYFEDKTIVYKPKDLTLISKYNNFIKSLRKINADITIPTYEVLTKDDYGYEPFIEYKSCNIKYEVEDYYNKFGQLIALMYMINGSDLHYENIIAHKSDPMVIDLETILHQYPELDFEETAEIRLKYEQADSILGSGLLPQNLFVGDDGKGIELSAFNGDKQKLPYKVTQLLNENTDELRFGKSEAFIKGANNIPMLNNEKVNGSDYVNQILDGFNNMMKTFYHFKNEIISSISTIFSDTKIRCIIRATQQYSNYLNEMNHPDYCRSAVTIDEMLDRLWYYPFKDQRVVPFERKELLNRDIPYFTLNTSNTNLYTYDGTVLDNYFDYPSINIISRKIKELNLENINKQMRYLLLSIAPSKIDEILKEKQITEEWLEKEKIEEIVHETLMEHTTIGNKDTISWLSIQAQGNRSTVSPMSMSLYDGVSGLCLFYISMYKKYKEEKYLNIAKKIFNSITNSITSNKGLISAFLGEFSTLYVAEILAKITGEDQYIEHIEKLKRQMQNNIDTEQELDVLSGSAGCILLFNELYNLTESDDYLKLTKKYADHLKEALNETKVHTNQHTQRIMNGIGHGSAGIALAMHVAGERLNTSQYNDIIEKNIEVELKYIEELMKHPLEDIKIGWTNGISGILIVFHKLGLLTEEHIKWFENIIIHQKIDLINLSNGYLSIVEFFHSIGDSVKADMYFTKVKQNIVREKTFKTNRIGDFDSKGLFEGLTGIGIMSLRLSGGYEIPKLYFI